MPRPSLTVSVALALACAALTGCSSRSDETGTASAPLRLVDVFKSELVEGSAGEIAAAEPVAEWRFDGSVPPGGGPAPATRGWEGHNVSGLAVREGRLVGRSTGAFPILTILRTAQMDNADQVHGFEVRARVSAGQNLSLTLAGPAPVNAPRVQQLATRLPWPATTPLLPGDEVQTYRFTSAVPMNMARAQRVLIRPTDAPDATFEIESVRIITEKEHLATVPSGVGWQGLKDVFRETLVSRAPETIRFEVDVPADARLEMAIGTMEDQPPTFTVTAAPAGGEPRVLLEHTLTTPHRWEPQSIDLAGLAGQRVTLSLALGADQPGTVGFWGTPTIRRAGRSGSSTPRGVIFIQADTLRADHLGLYGHTRDTAPFLGRLAAEGATFRYAFAQAGWTACPLTEVTCQSFPSSTATTQMFPRSG